MNLINWVEIPVTDLARAKAFYEGVFGVALTHLDMGPAAMEMFPASPDAPNASGALVRTEGYAPSHTGAVAYFSVDDIDVALAKVNAAGGRTLIPKMSIGEYGFIAQFEDSEGNRVGLHSAN